MLRLIVQTNAAAAKSYYQGSTGQEYYAEGQEQAGVWGGLGAKRLGLEGVVEASAFDALCENRHPVTKDKLTPRTKAFRRVGFDLNFHVPKSVSVLYGIMGDHQVLLAFQDSVSETLTDLEQETKTRVRSGGLNETRTTGNMVYSVFIHATSRPVNGIPDPHLHAHAFVFNETFDAKENRWKAIELGDVYKHAPYYESLFHARLAKKLSDLGFDIARTETGWEISGVPIQVLKMFSRRTEQIETAAKEWGIDDPELKSLLGAKTRERKQLRFTLLELRRIWLAKLSKTERTALDHVIAKRVRLAVYDPDAGRKALAFAVGHCFERSSVIPVKRLLAVALKHGIGQVSLQELLQELKTSSVLVRRYQGEELATTKEVLAEETRILQFAKQGRNTCRPLTTSDILFSGILSPQQQAAVRYVLSSADRVILIRGVAGSGKTTLIKECVNAIQADGKTVLLLAPSADASRGVLRKEGFAHAETVAKFLLDTRLQVSARNGVMWIDEAGLIGLHTLDQVFQVAGTLNARVVLSGDERQHKAVERGSPLVLLQRHANLVPATLLEIRRQTGRYKDAVQYLSQGQTEEGFDLLDRHLGWVKEITDDSRVSTMAADYLQSLNTGKTVLAVSPTHAEGQKLTQAIRATLKDQKRLTGSEHVYLRLDVRDLTLAERQEARFYRLGNVVEFHKQTKGFRAGERLTVTHVGTSTIAAKNARGTETILPLKLAECFQVYTEKTLSLALGDRVRITKNGKSLNLKRLDNGLLTTVTGFTAQGGIALDNGAVLPSQYAHLAHGYVVTSHASQGKTVDRVLVTQSSESFTASNREQFYVSVSRGRESVMVYTDDKARLRQAIQRSDPNLSAQELLENHTPPEHVWRGWVAKRLQAIKIMLHETYRQQDPTIRNHLEYVVRTR